MGRTARRALPSTGEDDARPLSRLDAAIAKGQTLELQALPRPVQRGAQQSDKLLLLGGRPLGEVNDTGRGFMAFDEPRGVWVGPFKRIGDLARFFLGPEEPQAPRPPPVVVGVPTKKGRTFWSQRVDLVPKK